MIEYLGLVLASAVLLIYLLKLRFSRNDYFWEKLGFPTVKTKLTLYDLVFKGTFPFDIDRVYYKELGDEKFGGIVELGVPVLLIKDLDLARNIFVKDFESFFDRRDFGRSDKILSESLFFLQGAKWKGMRAFLSPTFTSGKIRRMFHHMETTSQDMTKYIVEQCPKDKGGHVVVVQELMRKFAVEVIGTSVFGMQTNVFKDPNAVFFKFAMKTAEFDVPRKIRVSIIQSFPRIAEWLELKFLDNQAHEFLRRALADSLKVRESSSESRDDFIQLLVEAMRGDNKIDESESSDLVKDSLIKGLVGKQKLTLTENMAIGQGFLFFFAGLDTVSMFLSFAIYCLALNPEVQETLFAEVDRAFGSAKDKKLTYDEVNEMEYLDMFSSEVLRLFPPVVRLERKCTQDYTIPGTDKVIPKGTMVGVASEGIHRDEKYYPDPEKFDPERFNTENKGKRDIYAYMPFGFGPRNCIGMRFAQIESKTGLAYLVRNFQIEPTESTPIPMKYKKEVGGYRIPSDLQLRLIPRS